MKAGPVTIRHLLENRQRFCVPIYQRHYVWTRDKQWEPFWNDVRTKAIEQLNGRTRRFSHFMGAVVLEARGAVSSRQVTSFQVVDGQQRLTTFQLYLAAARDYAEQVGFKGSVGLIEGYLFNEKKHLMEDPEIEKFKVWPTKYDRDLLQDILVIGRKALRKKYVTHFYKSRDKIYEYSTVPNLLGGYGYFYDRIKHAVESDDLEDDFAETIEIGEDEDSHAQPTAADENKDRAAMELRLDALWEALIEGFKVVEITLEEGDDAQVIFETPPRGPCHLHAEHFQRTANGILDIEKLAFQHAPVRENNTITMALITLHIDLPEPTCAHHLGKTARIIPVCLVAHGAERTSHVPCFNNNRWKPAFGQLLEQPGR